MVFKCVGVKPATEPLAASLGAQRLAPGGAVAVEPTLQVVGWPNVFAAGDCNAMRDEKTAALAGLTGQLVARQILALEAGKPLATYPDGAGRGGLRRPGACRLLSPHPHPLDLPLHPHADLFGGMPPLVGGFTLGASDGVMQMGSTVQTGGTPARLKSIFSWLLLRVAGGSRWWGWVYRKIQGALTGAIAAEVKKAQAAQEQAGAPAAAPAT